MKKKTLLALAALAAAAGVSAQTVQAPSLMDNIYIGLQGGATAPMHGSPFFKSTRGMAGLEIGKQITPTFGLGVEGLFGVNTSSWKGRVHSTTAFDNSYVGVYGTVDLFNLFGGYNCTVRPFTIAAQAGAGWGHYYQSGDVADLNFVAAKFGLNFNFNATQNLTIAIKPSVIYNVNNPRTGGSDMNANRASVQLLAGVSYRFGDGFKCVRPYDAAEVEALNASVNSLRGQVQSAQQDATRWQAEANRLSTELDSCRNQAPQVVHDVTNIYNSVRFVFFKIGSSVITADQMPNVTMIADYLNNHPNSKVIVKGYASRDGNYDFNMRLAQARAESVKKALMNRYRIPESRIEAQGEGIGNMFEEESWNRVSICTLETE